MSEQPPQQHIQVELPPEPAPPATQPALPALPAAQPATQQATQQAPPAAQPATQQAPPPAQQMQQGLQTSVPLINGIPFYKTRLAALISTAILFFLSLISLVIYNYNVWILISCIINLGLYGSSLYFIYTNDNRYATQLILVEIILFVVSWLLGLILSLMLDPTFLSSGLGWSVFNLVINLVLNTPLYFYRKELLLNPILPVQKNEMGQVSSTLTPVPASAPVLQSVVSESPTQNPAVIQTVQNPGVTQTVVQNPAVTQTVVQNPTVTQTVVQNPTVTQTVVQNPTVTQTFAQSPAVTQTFAQSPAVTQSSVSNEQKMQLVSGVINLTTALVEASNKSRA
ncbi:hypothetical protein HDU92_006391 [Lobulomyces angularis]|nr:hypothetical protein HDU92_006391 [Lobulomyces angularis]